MVSVELGGIDAVRQVFGGEVVNKALNSTLNKLAAQGKTLASKAIRETYNIKARDLNAQMSVRRARANDLESVILATGPRISLMYFDPEQTIVRGEDAIVTKRARGKNGSGGLFAVKVRKGFRVGGVTVKVRNDGGRKLVKGPQGYGAFIAQGRRGQLGGGNARNLFNRSEAKQGRGNFQVFMRQGKERLPIDKLTGPAVAQMLGQKKDVVEEFISRESGRILDHELDFFVSQVRNRG